VTDNKWRIGVDVGGTFTDVAIVNENDGTMGVAKVSSTPTDFGVGVIEAIEQALIKYKVETKDVTLLAHATTVVTNAILEEKGAKVGLISTLGFRDILELRRSARADLYDLFQDPPSVLVKRRNRFEITERIGADGKIVSPITEEEIERVIIKLKAADVEAVAVSFLFSFLNDEHEALVGKRLRKALPDIPVFLSSEVLPEIREFERTSTTAICAYVGPILSSYLARLKNSVTEKGLPAPYVMGSGGGLFEIEESLMMPAMAAESGPAAGVIAAALAGKQIIRSNLLSFDMGGTTAKASLIKDGVIETTPEYEVGGEGSGSRWLNGTGHPIRVPVIDLAEVSAGGGSIAWIDPVGSLRVGPNSAGAAPGPVCYGRGGVEPTVTDANLVLGRLDSKSLLGGDLSIDISRAEAAINEKIAIPLNVTIDQAASSIIKVVNNAMGEALRIVSVERGHDAREFSLICFGGAGPLHAVALAEELGMKEVIVPPIPGAFSALGLIGSDISRDYGRTFFSIIDQTNPQDVENVFRKLEEDAKVMLAKTGIRQKDWRLKRSVDVRYTRQAYELNVDAPKNIDASNFFDLADRFHQKHAITYGHSNETEQVQLVTLRLSAKARLPGLKIRQKVSRDEGIAEIKSNRDVWFDEVGKLATPIYERELLSSGAKLTGPAIVESLDSTIVIPPHWEAVIDGEGFILLTFSGVESHD
jgi:N-methylhydantoinase A